MLNSEVPLVNFRVSHSPSVEIAGVAEAPLCQLAVLGSLRTGQATGEWAGTCRLGRGGSKTRELMVKIVFGEKYARRFGESRAGVLKIGGNIHAIKDPGASAQHGVGSELIGETKPRSEIVSVHGRVATAGGCKGAGASDLANLPKLLDQRGGQ